MGIAHPPRQHEREVIAPPRHGVGHDDGNDYIGALLEENAQLRGLVIHLSKLVLKNVIDKK